LTCFDCFWSAKVLASFVWGLNQRYLDAMLGFLCITSAAISSANITMETFVSAYKFAMYNKYRNEPKIFPYRTPDWIPNFYYNIMLFDQKISFTKITFE